jgi:hypothetical protein
MRNLLGILLIASMCVPSSGFAREVSSFDRDWKFQRFGPMPDRTNLPEPGGRQWVFPVSASSSEASKGNTPERAFDGDKTTRWCAEGSDPKQNLTIDLKKPAHLGTVQITWELPLVYQYAVEGSADNQNWTILCDQTRNDKADATALKVQGEYRYVRIRTTGLPNGKWASIAEVELTDAAGKAIVNKQETTAGLSAEAVAFDDSKWRNLSVPHDWESKDRSARICRMTRVNCRGAGSVGTASILRFRRVMQGNRFSWISTARWPMPKSGSMGNM